MCHHPPTTKLFFGCIPSNHPNSQLQLKLKLPTSPKAKSLNLKPPAQQQPSTSSKNSHILALIFQQPQIPTNFNFRQPQFPAAPQHLPPLVAPPGQPNSYSPSTSGTRQTPGYVEEDEVGQPQEQYDPYNKGRK